MMNSSARLETNVIVLTINQWTKGRFWWFKSRFQSFCGVSNVLLGFLWSNFIWIW